MAVLLAGLPTSVPGTTVNRLCGSSVESVIQASRAIEAGDATLILAGGVESMSRAPWVVTKPDRPFAAGSQEMFTTTIGWRMTNPEMDPRWTISNGQSAELLADRFGISREEQDEFAVLSHRNAAAAWDAGLYPEVIPVPGTDLVRDEGIRADASIESLAALKPAFRADGTVTAGNSSPLNDGASMLFIGGERTPLDSPPLARITGRAAFGNDPDVFGIAPVGAVERALARAGRSWADVDLVELNEAFAAQVIACDRELSLDPATLNVNGGAIALGHPIGATGARIVVTLLHEMARRGSHRGLATLCVSGGMGIAALFERD
jgi:acetyl-CoA acetyltransferase family protein